MTSELPELAQEMIGADCFYEIAMGTGETQAAFELVQTAASKGHWICLKNVHLVSGWLPTLDRLLDELSIGDGRMHDNFRLWMTAEPVFTLPPTLLQRCQKIISEVINITIVAFLTFECSRNMSTTCRRLIFVTDCCL